MSDTRLYVVDVTLPFPDTKQEPVRMTHLVDASSQAQALRYIVAGIAQCRVATPKEVAELVAEGVRVETA